MLQDLPHFTRRRLATSQVRFAETQRSLTRRVFVAAHQCWIVWLDGDAIGTHVGGLRVGWNESVGQTRVKEFRARERAVAAYHKGITDKLAGGYQESYGRAVTTAGVPKSPTKLGKKKSR